MIYFRISSTWRHKNLKILFSVGQYLPHLIRDCALIGPGEAEEGNVICRHSSALGGSKLRLWHLQSCCSPLSGDWWRPRWCGSWPHWGAGRARIGIRDEAQLSAYLWAVDMILKDKANLQLDKCDNSEILVQFLISPGEDDMKACHWLWTLRKLFMKLIRNIRVWLWRFYI